MVDASVRAEVERAITAELSRRGVGGTVVIRENIAELHGVGSSVVAIDLGEWVEQWNLLPPEMQSQRAEAAAQRLQQSLGTAAVGGGGRGLPDWLPKAAGGVVVFLALAFAGRWLVQSNFFGEVEPGSEPTASAAPSGSVPTESAPAASAREARACDAARKRLYAGASMNMDVAGWVVELWLAREGDDLAGDEAVTRVAAGIRELEAEGEVQTRPGEAWLGQPAVTIELHGSYVPAFFEAKGRDALVAFAERLTNETKATHAALTARCAHRSTRDVGAWFRGRGDASAVAALWYGAASEAPRPAVDPKKLAATEGALRALQEAAGHVTDLDERARLAGAKIHRSDSGMTSFRFPLGGPTRAAKLGRELAEGAMPSSLAP